MDYASATPISPRVRRAMEAYFSEYFFNPAALYTEALSVRQTIENARQQLADYFHVQAHEVYFFDGATEANNMVIQGIIKTWKKKFPGQQAHIITTAIEHASVLELCKYLENNDVKVSYLPVNNKGQIHPNDLKQALQKNTVLVSVGYANGEIGSVQDLRAIMKQVRHARKKHDSRYPIVHSDAVQAINYCEEIRMHKLGIDAMVLNAAKIYGPKKIALACIKKDLDIEPLLFGGNQEQGLRSGTENVPTIIGLKEAFFETRSISNKESSRLGKLKTYFHQQLEHIPDCVINSNNAPSIPNIVNISFPHLSHEEIMLRLDARGIACSVKSACKSGEEGDSHVIIALRDGTTEPTGSLRFSMGRTSRKSDIDMVIKELHEIVSAMNATYKQYYR